MPYPAVKLGRVIICAQSPQMCKTLTGLHNGRLTLQYVPLETLISLRVIHCISTLQQVMHADLDSINVWLLRLNGCRILWQGAAATTAHVHRAIRARVDLWCTLRACTKWQRCSSSTHGHNGNTYSSAEPRC